MFEFKFNIIFLILIVYVLYYLSKLIISILNLYTKLKVHFLNTHIWGIVFLR